MFLKITKQFGKPICVALYAWFAALAVKKKPLPLLSLLQRPVCIHQGKHIQHDNHADDRHIRQVKPVEEILEYGSSVVNHE